MHASRILALSLALFGCLALTLFPALSIAQTPSAVDTELERVRGNWRVVELVENGQEIPEEQMQYWLPGGGNLEIVDYTILFSDPVGGSKTTREFRIDPTSYPKRITIKNKKTHQSESKNEMDYFPNVSQQLVSRKHILGAE